MKPLVYLMLSFITMSASATTINYDEQIDGDLGGANSYIGTLGLGSNTVSGTIAYDPFDSDGYLFDIGTGKSLTSFYLESKTITKVDPSADVIAGYYFEKYEKDPYIENRYNSIVNYGLYYFPETVGQSINILDQLLIAGKLSEGTYGIRPYVMGGVTIDYTYSLDVTAVPLPASIWLLVTGLFGMFSVTRYKK